LAPVFCSNALAGFQCMLGGRRDGAAGANWPMCCHVVHSVAPVCRSFLLLLLSLTSFFYTERLLYQPSVPSPPCSPDVPSGLAGTTIGPLGYIMAMRCPQVLVNRPHIHLLPRVIAFLFPRSPLGAFDLRLPHASPGACPQRGVRIPALRDAVSQLISGTSAAGWEQT
jgi:hypothetical protein